MELLDILNENGIKTGETATRDDCHKKGLWHRAVIIAVVNDYNQVLMQQRAKNKDKYPNLWDISVAGHVPAGEDSLSSASTEIMEEIGFMLPRSVRVEDFRFMFSFRSQLAINKDFIENQIYDFFIYRANIDESNIKIQKNEVQAVKFLTAFEIKEMQEQGMLHPRSEWVDVLYKFVNRL